MYLQQIRLIGVVGTDLISSTMEHLGSTKKKTSREPMPKIPAEPAVGS